MPCLSMIIIPNCPQSLVEKTKASTLSNPTSIFTDRKRGQILTDCSMGLRQSLRGASNIPGSTLGHNLGSIQEH